MNWNEITINQYQAVSRELKEDHEDELSLSIALLSVITNKPIDYYENEIPLTELKSKLSGLKFLTNKPKPKKLHSKVNVNGKWFVFNLDLYSISAGQYIDLTEYVKDAKLIDENLHLILATLCEEVNWWGKKKKTSLKDKADWLQNNMTMPYVFTLSGFFLNNYQKLTKATLNFLESEKEKAMKNLNKIVNQTLSDIGVGTIR